MTAPRPASRTFQDLVVWQKAHQLVLGVYQYSSNFPKAEIFGLTSQLRRAAVSISANIAEGFCRRGRNDKARMLNIAHSSLEECRYYLILAADLNYGSSDELMISLEEVRKILQAYTKAVLSSDP